MAPWALPAATLLAGLFANRGNGGSEFSDEQKQLYGTQAELADMMKDLYASRIANEEKYMGGAMDRVFGYVDEALGRQPDLLHAPGIFEFMPRDGFGQNLERPEWTPYAPGEKVVTPDPPPPFEVDDAGWRSLADMKPVRDVVPDVDVGTILSMLPGAYSKLTSGGPRTLEEALDLGDDVETDWMGWMKDLPDAPELLRNIEERMRDTLGLDTLPTAEQREAFNMGPHSGRYNPEDMFTWGTRDVSSDTFAPPGASDPGTRPVMVDSVTGAVIPTYPASMSLIGATGYLLV